MTFCFFDFPPHPAADGDRKDSGNLPTTLLSCVHMEGIQCSLEAGMNGMQRLGKSRLKSYPSHPWTSQLPGSSDGRLGSQREHLQF